MYFVHHVHVHIAIYYPYRKELSVKFQNKFSGFHVQKYFKRCILLIPVRLTLKFLLIIRDALLKHCKQLKWKNKI